MIIIDGEKIGLGGDVIIHVDGIIIKSSEELHLYLGKYYVEGKRMIFRVLREGSELDLILI